MEIVKKQILALVNNKTLFSLVLLSVAFFITFFASNYDGFVVLLGKSILLFLPLHLTYRTMLAVRSQIDEFKKSRKVDELVSILISIGGMAFLMFCFIELIRNY